MSNSTTTKPVVHTHNANEILSESMGNFEKALKSGIKLQEETVNLWKETLPKLGSPDELQAKLEAISADAFSATRKRFDETIETLSRAGKQTLALCEVTANVSQARSLPDVQSRLQDVTESWFAVLRSNVKIAADTNAKMIGAWTDLIGRFAPVAK